MKVTKCSLRIWKVCMSYELALKLEQEGNLARAYQAYLGLVASSVFSPPIIRGLVRTTIRVGDIKSLSQNVVEYCKTAKVSQGVTALLAAKLNCEIGNITKAIELFSSIQKSELSKNDLFDYTLLQVDLKVLRNKIEDAHLQLIDNQALNLNLLRRKVELEITLGRPKDAIQSLKEYVSALNLEQKSQGKPGNFRTASGMLFNLANQIWLDQDFATSGKLPTLFESMKIIREHINKPSIHQKIIFNQESMQKGDFQEISWSSVKGLGSKSRQKKMALEFLSHGLKDSMEFRFMDEIIWDKRFTWNCNVSYFFCEESGYVSSSNFGLVSSSQTSKSWSEYIRQIGEHRVPDPIDLFIGGAVITRLLALQIIEGASSEAFTVIPRSALREFRVLPPRYSTLLN